MKIDQKFYDTCTVEYAEKAYQDYGLIHPVSNGHVNLKEFGLEVFGGNEDVL